MTTTDAQRAGWMPMERRRLVVLSALNSVGQNSFAQQISDHLRYNLISTNDFLYGLEKLGWVSREVKIGQRGRKIGFWSITDAGRAALAAMGERQDA